MSERKCGNCKYELLSSDRDPCFDCLAYSEWEEKEMGMSDNAKAHERICDELNQLYERKNHDYGDSFHLTYQKWGLPMAAIRLEDKLQRFETLIKAEKKVKDESIRDTLIDLANYSIMTVMKLDNSIECQKEEGSDGR